MTKPRQTTVSKDASNDDTRAAGASLPEIDAGDVVVSFEDGDGGVFSDALEKTAPKSTRTRRFPETVARRLESDGVVPAHLAHASEVRGATWLDAPRNAGKTKKKGGEQFGVCAAGETVARLFAVPKPARDSARVDGGFAAVRVRVEILTRRSRRKATPPNTSPCPNSTLLCARSRPGSCGWRASPGSRGRSACPASRGACVRRRRRSEEARRVQRGFNAAYAELRAVRRARGAHAQRRGRRRLDPRHAARETPRVACHAGDAAPGVPRVKRPGVDAGGRRPPKCSLSSSRATPRRRPARIRHMCRIPRRSGHVRARMDVATAALRVRVRLPGEGLIALADQSPGEPFESTRETLERRTHVYAPNGVGGASRNEPRTQNASPRTQNAASCGWLFQPKSWSSIRPGEEVSLDLYVRPTCVGIAELPFVICYEPPEPAPPSLRFRVARVATRIEVTPSLEITARVFDAATHPAARVIRVAARNVSSIPLASASYGRGPNDGRVNGSSGSSGSAANEKRRARARVYVSRARRAAPPRVRKRPLDARRERLLERRGATPFVSRSERKRKPRKASVRFVFATARRGSRAGRRGRDAPRRRDRAREGAGHLAHRRARGGVRGRASARRVGRRVVCHGGRVGGAHGARQTDARRLRLRRVRRREPRARDRARLASPRTPRAFESSQTPAGFEDVATRGRRRSPRRRGGWEATDPETGARIFRGAHTAGHSRRRDCRVELDSDPVDPRGTAEGRLDHRRARGRDERFRAIRASRA